MSNPFCEASEIDERNDHQLIKRILAGSRADLEVLIGRHQAWIYNIALKMVLDPHDAQDVTQEILIKLLTKLATYSPEKGSFRTWLYRIVANHVINMKKRKTERLFSSIEACAQSIEKIPDETVEHSPETRILIEELKIKCLTGMLLCLERKQRLVFTLTEIFDMDSRTGSRIMDIAEANYRQLLSRGRKRVYNFINQNCGLIHADNPCHCQKKLRGFIREGFVDPDKLLFYKEKVDTIQETLFQNKDGLNRYYIAENTRLFREHPFYPPPDFENWIQELLKNESLNTLLALN